MLAVLGSVGEIPSVWMQCPEWIRELIEITHIRQGTGPNKTRRRDHSVNVKIQIRVSSRVGKVPVATAYNAGIRVQRKAPSQVPKKNWIHQIGAVDASNNKIMVGYYNMKTNYVLTVVFESIQQLKIKISR